MLKRILILITTTLVLFSIFLIDSNAGELYGAGLGPTLQDVTVAAGQTIEKTMIAYNPFDTDVTANIIVSDNLKDYIKPEPETIFIEKHTSPENAKTITLAVSVPFWTLGNKDIKGEITLRGTGGMVSPAVGSTFYLHVKGMTTLNLTLIGIGVVLVIVAIVIFVTKRRRKGTIQATTESIEPIDFFP